MARKNLWEALARVVVATGTGGWLQGAGEAANQVIDLVSRRDRNDPYGMMLRQITSQLEVLGKVYRADDTQIENALRQALYAFQDKALTPDELVVVGMDPLRAAAMLCQRVASEILSLDDETTRDVCREAIHLAYKGLLKDTHLLPAVQVAFKQRVLECLERLSADVGSLNSMPAQQEEALRLLQSIIGTLAAVPTRDASSRSQGEWQKVRIGLVPAVPISYQARSEFNLANLLDRRPLTLEPDNADPAASLDGLAMHVVLVGMGGTGKTQLAAHYTASVQENLDVRVWVSATNRTAVIAAYSRAAIQLGLRQAQDPTLDLEDAAAAFLDWTTYDHDRSWLVVLDDVQDPADISALIPDGPRGQVVLTTRTRDRRLSGWGRVVDVGVYTSSEARAYLAAIIDSTQRPQQHATSNDEITGLAQDLGRHPLALAQAAAYLANQPRTTVATYRQLLADTAQRLAIALPSEDAPVEYRPEDRAHASVTTTWTLSIEQADRLHPQGLASVVLDVLAWLDPSGVPTDVLCTPILLEYFTNVLSAARRSRSKSSDGVVIAMFPTPAEHIDEVKVLRALAALDRFSVTTPTTNLDLVAVHQLVQRVARERAGHHGHNVPRIIADALQQVWPEDDHRADLAPLIDRLRSNTAALSTATHTTGDLYQPDAHSILIQAGISLEGQPRQLVEYWLTLSEQCLLWLGEHHPDTLLARSNLALAYKEAGRLDEALPILERALLDDLKVLGPHHRYSLATRNNLALIYQDLGRLDDALYLQEQVLADRIELLGDEHPDTLAGRANLALTYRMAGKLDKAIRLLEQSVKDHTSVLGTYHYNTLGVRNNLAHTLLAAGRFDDAIPLLERNSADHTELLGQHPRTLSAHYNLALGYLAVGRTDEGLSLLERTLADRNELLGELHPATLVTRHNLTNARQAAGRPLEAATGFGEAPED